MQFLPLLALVATAAACGAGTGTITAKPTFSFTYSPPVSWSYVPASTSAPVTMPPGQKGSQADAEQQISNDIELAVVRALKQLDITTADVMIYADSVKPVSGGTINACSTTTEGTQLLYVVENGALRKQCAIGAKGPADFTQKASVRIESSMALAESQWTDIARRVQSNLETLNVYFEKDITVL